MKYLSLLAFALIVFACGETADTTTERTDMDMPETTVDREMPNTADMAPDPMVGETVNAVQSAGGDITALSPDAAVGNIDGWIGKLRGMDGADGIVSDLESLKTELTSGNIDGGKVSGILSQLASSTREMGKGNQGLNTLASALDAGAAKLGGK